MPKRHQQWPAKKSAGRNNPKKSTEITTGTYKKPETYHEQAMEHENPGKLPQDAKVPPERDPTMGITLQADSRAAAAQSETRSGSDSNAHNPRKGDRLHEHNRDQNQPQHHDHPDYFNQDLHGDNLAGENYGLRGPEIVDYHHSANDIKSLHTTLADLSDDELKNIVIVSQGSRLEQGAKYIDLRHLEQGEFAATANMIAEPDHLYVPKKDIGYVLWNRLTQVSNPKRLDEEG
ncbi:MAG TPA: hypothetical protein VFU49_17130 [Ktedonobacteraceae bacterium]|nr:hypothetical protein [Ktedonobacteraceae bacterium]